jgi:hypothetical protein
MHAHGSCVTNRVTPGSECQPFPRAYEHGADVIITIDDDNFVSKTDDGSPEEDFVGKHCVVGTTQTLVGLYRLKCS